MGKIRITPDAELATPQAIKFRIEQIGKENGGRLTPGNARRIDALRLRLPEGEFAEPLPAVDVALLMSKGDEEWGDRRRTPA